jgi:hypothetical protein
MDNYKNEADIFNSNVNANNTEDSNEVKTSTRWIFALSYFGLMLLLDIRITYAHGIHVNVIG